MPKYIKRVLSLMISVIFILSITGCSNGKEMKIKQFETEGSNITVARMNIRDYGTVSFRIYPDEAKEAAEKFIELAKAGFYDGKPFFFIVDEYLIMGGDEEAGGKKTEVYEKNENMYPFKGSLCLNYLSETEVDLSRFCVICMDKEKLKGIEELVEHKGYTLSDYIKFGYKTELTKEELDTYRQYGGTPWLYGHTVVLGQAYEGMEILDEIMKAHTEDADALIVIENIEFG